MRLTLQMLAALFPLWLVPPPAVRRPGRLRAWLGLRFAAPLDQATDEVDELVIARARRGDHLAFTEIVRHYDHRLRALAFRLLEDRDRMDDVLQDVYVKAFRALPGFKGTSALGTWLYRITYNACMDDLRRRRPAASLDDDAGDVAAVDPRPGPAETAISRQDLASALAQLPPDQRAAVLLVDAYGLDYAEAAEALDVRGGTIASRLNRARTALRSAMGEGR